LKKPSGGIPSRPGDYPRVTSKGEDGLVVLDSRTDKVEQGDLNPRIEHYKPQLKAYSDAIKCEGRDLTI